MDKEHLKGAVDKAKGAVKDAVGGYRRTPVCKSRAKWIRRRALLVRGSATQKTPRETPSTRRRIDHAFLGPPRAALFLRGR